MWVTVHLGNAIQCRVWVSCTPDTPSDEVDRRAKRELAMQVIAVL